jgi:hypothetical protein
MDIFNLLFDEQICALIVDETNKQAEIVFFATRVGRTC